MWWFVIVKKNGGIRPFELPQSFNSFEYYRRGGIRIDLAVAVLRAPFQEPGAERVGCTTQLHQDIQITGAFRFKREQPGA